MGCAIQNRQLDAPAEIGNGGMAIGCTGQNMIGRRGDGDALASLRNGGAAMRMRRPNEDIAAQRGDALAG